MKSTLTEPELTLHIADEIRRNSQLFDTVDRASQFLQKEYNTIPENEDITHSSLSWKMGQVDGSAVVIPELEEIVLDGSVRSYRRVIPIGQTSDPISMRIWMRRLIRDVIGKRLDTVMARWEEKLVAWEVEEESNGQ